MFQSYIPRLLEQYRRLARSRNSQLWRIVFLWLIPATVALIRSLRKDRIHVRATTLGYWTLMATVPMLVLSFALMGPLGLLDDAAVKVREALFASVLAASMSDVGQALDSLIGGVHLETLGIAGFLGLMLAGAKMYFSVEQAYNDIFHVRLRRRWALRFIYFYAMVTLTPLLLALGFVATSSMGHSLPSGLLGRAVPVALTSTAFVIAIKLLPQVEVRWSAALVGGLSSAILFESAKIAFAAYTQLLGASSSAARLYGSLGLLPVFLLWIYVLWIIALLGVEMAYVVQDAESLLAEEKVRLLQPEFWERRPDAFFGLQALLVVVNAFQDGKGASDPATIASRLSTSHRAVVECLEDLESAGLLVRTEPGAFLPALPPEDLTVEDVITRYRGATVPPCRGTSPGNQVVQDSLRAMGSSMSANIASLARKPGAEPAPGQPTLLPGRPAGDDS